MVNPEFVIKVESSPKLGFIASLYINAGRNTDHQFVKEVAKCFVTEDPRFVFFAHGPKGKWSPTKEKSITVLKRGILSEVKSLEKNDDLRPSQVRRLELLKKFLSE